MGMRMSVTGLLGVLLILSAAGYALCRNRATTMVQGRTRDLHSRPGYYGWNGALMAFLPAFAALVLWLVIQPMIVERRIASHFAPETMADPVQSELLMGDIRRVAGGFDQAVAQGQMNNADIAKLDTATSDIRAALEKSGVALGSDVSPEVLSAARDYRAIAASAATLRNILVLVLAAVGMAYAYLATRPDFWARNRVELVVKGLLITASSIAILTTLGIIASMLTETVHFFQQYPFTEFFFGLTWSPNFRGNSELGILPLIWGTMYISLVAMVVAVPVGLFAAIYLAEYATPTARAWIKPLIELIAGIPTVVFGLFALATVGPFLRDWIAQPLGLGDSGSSVMTAGLVIGILNIPFISSLSDDIINAVPQSLRDGSLAIGATKSETVRRVVLPAALPGIMGAILMAASRAIGETMIVTMGAGAAARLDLNPFEAMTTITVKIVSQLTGDTDFAAPETLVAFALGMTLFVITLALNVIAMIIVRKYREQYE
jgi:phosphate transport system permease protein